MHSFRRVLPLRLAVWVVAGVAALPLLVVMSSVLSPDTEVWRHLGTYVLPDLVVNTAWLIGGVLVGVLILGVPLAWLTAMHEFPGRRLFSWALMLPLAMPAYVLAFVQVGLLDFIGPVQTALRDWFGPTARLPEIRSLGGAILVLSLSFYPYVYLLARNAFASQGQRALEVGQSLGLAPWAGFWRVALPLARPWIAAGALLALMETLADFGAVYIFGVDTFTTAIYKAWFSLQSLPAATQLASLLVLLAMALISIEQWQRRWRRYAPAGRAQAVRRRRLGGWHGWAAAGFAALVLAVAFLIPLAQLLVWAVEVAPRDLDSRYPGFVLNSLMLAGLAALVVMFLALIVGYGERRLPTPATRLAARVAAVGYAVPGTVLAVGVFVPIAWLDNQLIALLGLSDHSIIKGTLAVMLLALTARFLSVGLSSVSSGLNRVTHSQEMAARSLGSAGIALVARLHLPLLRGSLLTGLLLVFVDVMKEMPITLMTRPSGWDTLAVRIFEMTSEGEWQRAALPAVVLVLAGLLPVALLTRGAEDEAVEVVKG